MDIKFHSAVIITQDIDKMKPFYTEVLCQEVAFDFGGCIAFKSGLSLWQLDEAHIIAQKTGSTFHKSGNRNFELCFETDDFETVVSSIEQKGLEYLHKVQEENWGQQTIRFYDPEKNLIEVGETLDCFIKRFYKAGMTVENIAKRTSVPVDYIKNCLKKTSL